MAVRVAMITGATGQDGAYLAELLLSKGYVVHGIKRRSSAFNTSRVDHLYQDPHGSGVRFFLHYGDMTDSTNLIRIIQEVKPTENLQSRRTEPCAWFRWRRPNTPPTPTRSARCACSKPSASCGSKTRCGSIRRRPRSCMAWRRRCRGWHHKVTFEELVREMVDSDLREMRRDGVRNVNVFVAAGKVGGISANSRFPADFIADNIAIAHNTIGAAHRCGVKRLVYLGSSCIYPRLAPQPMTPDMLLSGPLEPTNQWYAVAKIAGIKLCEAYRPQHGADFVSVMPTNLYGPGDNNHPADSHVPAALIRRFHEAKLSTAPSVIVWGTGTLRRAQYRNRRRYYHCRLRSPGCRGCRLSRQDRVRQLAAGRRAAQTPRCVRDQCPGLARDNAAARRTAAHVSDFQARYGALGAEAEKQPSL